MPAILTFVLVAPLGAMGALAVGERRGGWDRPARSAVLGVVAGCLGISRIEEERHAALSAGLGLAIRREHPPTAPLSDYHTAQTTRARRNQSFATRREELSAERETVLSRRDYRADIGFTIALWPRAACQWTLDDLAAALLAPHFTPYLGRKSCPLGLPMAPVIVQAASMRQAMLIRDASAATIERSAMRSGEGGMVWADQPGPDEPALGLAVHHTETRRDEPLSRARWQFALRPEIAALWPGDQV